MKKILSLLSAFAIMATMAVSVSAETKPTISLEASSTGLKAGDVVTVICKYNGIDVTPYDDNEGAGQKITSAQIRISIPGGIGTVNDKEQFLRGGVTNVSAFSTGSPQWNWDKDNEQFTAVITNISDPMNTSGTIFTITMKLNKDVTSDLKFDLVSEYDNKIYWDDYSDWELGKTHRIMTGDFTTDLSLATIKAPTPSTPTATAGKTQDDGDEIFYTDAVEFTGDSIKVKVTNDKVTDKSIDETLEREGAVLGGKTKILPIIKYTPSADLKGSTFTIVIGDKTYTYKIAE